VLDTEARESSVGEEMTLVRQYVEIQQVRFGDRLSVAIDVESNLDDVPLPPLSVQPLVENAIRHGLTPKTDAGRIDVRVHRRGLDLVIEVEDNGVGLAMGWTPGRGPGTGLRNLQARLEAQYGAAGTVALFPAQTAGAMVRLTVPMGTR
jgi:LytS/YehU family sensor histidine kinase